mgnify:CR=1 FL=1
MRKLCTLLLSTVLLLIPATGSAGEILVYAGAGLMKPLQELTEKFEHKHDCRVSMHYGGSGEIFGLMQTGKKCDVFIPGAKQYTQKALQEGWIVEESIKDLVLHIPAIAVPKRNPAEIESLQDLASPGAELALGDPRACAIGNVSVQILKNKGIYEKARKNTKVFGPTVNQLLMYVATAQVDCTVIWADLTERNKHGSKIKTVEIQSEHNIVKTIPSAVTTKARENDLARELNSYLGSKEAMKTWEKWGFKNAETKSP